MGTRSIAQVAPTSATIALNAYIYGYGGHSLVTPHATLKQLWWTEERIKAKVDKPFVVSKLRGEERDFLNRELAFGEGLTNETYLEWITGRARRLFLILTEVGVPDQIFGCVDDLWDDDDLPVPRKNVRSMDLAIENDELLNKKFFDTQFLYLLRELKQGSHIDYGHREHIPMEYVNTLPPAVSLQQWDRIHFPEKPEEMFTRRKYPLTDKDTGGDLRESFLHDVKKAQHLYHEHIAPVWASYTSDSAAYVISDFVGEHTLGTFIDHRNPTQFQRLCAAHRPILLCEWMHCLADALASLHQRQAAHTTIRPSNILIDRENKIAFADVGSLRGFQYGKKVNKTEIYDYAAPESPLALPPLALESSPPISSMGAFSKIRKLSSSTSSSSGGSSNGSNTRSNSVCTAPTSPMTPQSPSRINSMSTITTTLSSPPKSFSSFRNFSRHLPHASFASSAGSSITVPSSPTTVTHLVPSNTSVETKTSQAPPEYARTAADIYSLGCIFLDIITFLLRGKTNDFVKFRTTRIPSPIANNKRARNDTSFHASPDKISQWIDILKTDSTRLLPSQQISSAIPALLDLVHEMLSHTPALRPTAIHLRDRLHDILVNQAGLETLCCANRAWHPLPIAHDAVDTSDSSADDWMAAAAGASESGSSIAEAVSHFDDDEEGDGGSLASRATERKGEGRTRRRSSAASAATAKIGAWRRKLSRSQT